MVKPKLAAYANENDGDGRYYTNPVTGERLPSVTSVLKMADKSGVAQYAADQTMLWCVNNVDALLSKSPQDGFKSGRWRWRDAVDERAQVGTQIHETIEAEHTGSWDFPVLNDEQKEIMAEWRKLNDEVEIKPILSEFTVWNPTVAAGTADLYCEIDGVRWLIDLKTSRNTWPEHSHQLAALWASPVRMHEYEEDKWEEIPAPEYDKVGIIHLRAAERNEYGTITRPAIHKIIEVTDLEENYRAFKAYADVWQAKQDIAKAEKARSLALRSGF